jgi:uncharacterized protein YraI
MPSFRTLIIAGATLVAAGLIPAVASAQEQQIIAYTTTDLNLREGPSTDYRVITSMQQGAEVRILYCSGNQTWCYLQYRQYVGWASSRYLTSSPPQYAQLPPQPSYQYPQQQYQQYPQQYPQYPQQQVYQPYPPPPPPPPQQQPQVVVVQPNPYPYYYWSGPYARFNFWLNLMFH